MSIAPRQLFLVALLGLGAACLGLASGEQTSSLREPGNDELLLSSAPALGSPLAGSRSSGAGASPGPAGRLNNRLLTVPSSLARFLLYNSRQGGERQTQTALTGSAATNGYKRSSSQLDALTGVTLGKRSAPAEFVNLEPVFGRQNLARSPARVYDMRWAPVDAIEAPPPSTSGDY